MDEKSDIRWKQRFSNYKKALKRLSDAVDLSSKRNLSELEKQGLIQSFEFTHELSWKVLKDFLEEQGDVGILGSKDAVRRAFNRGIISNGEIWLEMIESRNLSTHTYDDETTSSISEKIKNQYISLFKALESEFSKYE